MKDIRLKTSQIPVIEKCKFDSNENSILHLLGPDAAKKDLSEFERYKFEEDENLKKLTSFKEVIGFGCKFYYQLIIFEKDKIKFTEIGLGTLVEKEEEVLLQRLAALSSVDEDGKVSSLVATTANFPESEYTHIHVCHYLIQNAMQLLLDPDTIPVSTSKDGPSPIYLENETFLGKVDDQIQAVPFTQIFSLKSISEHVVHSFSNFAKKISVKASSLFCKLLEANTLVLHHSDKQAGKEGAIIYDKGSKCLKYYDGEKWKLLFGQEDSEDT
jgi:hypothetical protein